MLAEFADKGIRFSVDAEELLASSGRQPELFEKILLLKKPFISKKDIEDILALEKKVEVIRTGFMPEAKEYDANVRIMHTRDVTGKSRTKGEVDNFISYFRNRFERISRLLRNTRANNMNCTVSEVKKHLHERVRIIVIVSGKRETKKGNTMFEVEDLSGSMRVIISAGGKNEAVAEKAKNVMLDDVIAITGKMLDAYMIAEDIEWPDLPITGQKVFTEEDIAIAYLSDLHFGSKYFLERYLDGFVEWMQCKGEARELAGKVKYIVISGDVVDGIGIYPNQEKELVVKDIYSQYQMFDDFVERLPDYVEVIVSPGNHDAVRRGEPMPAISEDLIRTDVTRIGSPSMVSLHDIKHLVYHGTSIDSMIANIPGASYMHPEKVMVEYLKRRHLSPMYGGNLIIPEDIDYMVIDEVPNVLHCGHVHKNGYTQYRGTLVINSGTFQDRTDFQVKQGHVPTPALVPVYETKHGRLKTLDFKSG